MPGTHIGGGSWLPLLRHSNPLRFRYTDISTRPSSPPARVSTPSFPFHYSLFITTLPSLRHPPPSFPFPPSSQPESTHLLTHLTALAPKFPRTKFISIIGSQAIENYPDRNLPTLIVYRAGEVMGQIVGGTGVLGKGRERGQSLVSRFPSGLGQKGKRTKPRLKPTHERMTDTLLSPSLSHRTLPLPPCSTTPSPLPFLLDIQTLLSRLQAILPSHMPVSQPSDAASESDSDGSDEEWGGLRRKDGESRGIRNGVIRGRDLDERDGDESDDFDL
jgi:hypothetical protein